MNKLYQKRDPRGLFKIDVTEIGNEVGLDDKALKENISFLESEDFARFQIKPHYVKLTNVGIEFMEKNVLTSAESKDIEDKRAKFLQKLSEQGDKILGVNMYNTGRELGFDDRSTEDVVVYYRNKGFVEFPMLGPFIRRTHDWWNALNNRDRKILRQAFLKTLNKLTSQNKENGINERFFKPTEIFEQMHLRAFSEELIPMIVKSLENDKYLETSDEDDKVAITHQGTIETQEIERDERRQYEETMRRLLGT